MVRPKDEKMLKFLAETCDFYRRLPVMEWQWRMNMGPAFYRARRDTPKSGKQCL